MLTKDKELLDIVDVMKWEVYDEPSRIRRKQAIKIYKAIRSRKLKAEASKAKNSIVEKYGSCSICGFSFKPVLQIHHILPISEYGDNSEDNVICVCPNCHKALHYMYSFSKDDNFASVIEDLYVFFWTTNGIDSVKNLVSVYDRYVNRRISAIEFLKGSLEDNEY